MSHVLGCCMAYSGCKGVFCCCFVLAETCVLAEVACGHTCFCVAHWQCFRQLPWLLPPCVAQAEGSLHSTQCTCYSSSSSSALFQKWYGGPRGLSDRMFLFYGCCSILLHEGMSTRTTTALFCSACWSPMSGLQPCSCQAANPKIRCCLCMGLVTL